MKLNFSMQINIKAPYMLISTVWTLKCPTRWCYHYWRAWSSIIKLLKVTSLQYLYNIFKKKLGMEHIFCMQITSKLAFSILMEVVRHALCTQNRKLVISGVSHKQLDRSSRFTLWFLHADNNWTKFGLTVNLICVFEICWVSTADVVVKNDVLLLVLKRKVLQLQFLKCF